MPEICRTVFRRSRPGRVGSYRLPTARRHQTKKRALRRHEGAARTRTTIPDDRDHATIQIGPPDGIKRDEHLGSFSFPPCKAHRLRLSDYNGSAMLCDWTRPNLVLQASIACSATILLYYKKGEKSSDRRPCAKKTAGHPVLGANTHASRCQSTQPLFGTVVAAATGDSRLIRGTPCRQAVWPADLPTSEWLWSTVVHLSRLVPLIKRFQLLSTIAKRDRFERLKRSLSFATLWQVATHAPKGPRMHAMSPPWRG
jgi:hypothetical protein